MTHGIPTLPTFQPAAGPFMPSARFARVRPPSPSNANQRRQNQSCPTRPHRQPARPFKILTLLTFQPPKTQDPRLRTFPTSPARLIPSLSPRAGKPLPTIPSFSQLTDHSPEIRTRIASRFPREALRNAERVYGLKAAAPCPAIRPFPQEVKIPMPAPRPRASK